MPKYPHAVQISTRPQRTKKSERLRSKFVRKLSGFAKPSKANEAAYERAVEDVFRVARRLIDLLETASPPRNREAETQKARARAVERFA